MKRTIERIYEKNKNMNFLDNSHVTMQRASPIPTTELNLQLESTGLNNMGKGKLDEVKGDMKEGGYVVHCKDENGITVQHATRPPDVEDETLVEDLLLKKFEESAIGGSHIEVEDAEEEFVEETPEGGISVM